MTAKTAIIVGAGVAGLSAAWWLSRQGWRPLVLERAPNLRANGYMLGLSGPGYEVAGRMGLMPALESRHRPIDENVYLGRDGKILWRVRYPELLSGMKWITLARTELVEVLYNAVQADIEIRFGVTAAELDNRADGIEVILTDGRRLQADLLIGADGVHSSLRRRVFGADEDYVRKLGYRCAAFQLTDSMELGYDFLSYAEPGRLTEFYTLSEGCLATLYAWRAETSARVPPEEARAALRKAYAGAHPEVLRHIDLLPDDAPMFFDDMTMIEMPFWSSGRVVLLGDAAHCLTLLSGQGAGMAMTSAMVLAQELSHGEIRPGLARHEARLRPAIEKLQARSRKIAPMFIPATPRSFAVRNWMMRSLPRRLLAWYVSRSVRTEALLASSGLGPKSM